ncbi:MAG: amino acid-binding protein [Candidatus Abyssobacteria bacterium SURF_5]|uniref:Amino acid-binding protein n=1 Tax=Abyssobacteria bacterium (strain SURF_5) TaxID=2093360 RepID=A0A3A4NRL2_ABYX5|nr:MAG: amino acid-binding protein [Candidatus Abyssubacteria bacterium SURF_5]
MKVKQISVFLENKIGHVRMVTDELTKANLNLRAISLADSKDFGILRMVVEDPERAHAVLRAANHAVKETDVIAVEVPDHPGGLSDLLKTMEGCGVNIEYMYSVLERKSDKAVIILRVENTDEVIESLKNQKLRLLSSKEVYGVL